MSQLDSIAPASSAAPIAPVEGVAHRAKRGFAWLMLQTVAAKIVNTGATIVAAWYLLPVDYKLAALAVPLTMFVSVFQQLGVDQVLLSRGKEFQRWANPGFWMSASAGLGTGAIILLASPLVAMAYHAPTLVSVLAFLAISPTISGLTCVHQTSLQNQLKFKLLSLLAMAGAALQAVTTVFMARTGYGVYALVVPGALAAVLRGVVLLTVPIPIRFALDLGEWKYLVRDGILSLATQFLLLVASQGDFVLLAFLFPPSSSALGYLAFAFTFSLAIITPLVMNLGSVLLPALGQLRGEPERQVRAFLQAADKLAFIGIPLCLLQAVVAAPLLHALYGHKWDEVILPIQMLSVCMAVRIVCVTSGALVLAQGRFGFMFRVSAIYAIGFLGAVYIGALWRNIVAVTLAEGIFFVIFDNANMYLAIRYGKGKLVDVFRLYSIPATGAGVAAIAAAGSPAILGAHHEQPVIRLALEAIVMFCVYIIFVRAFAPQKFAEFGSLLKTIRAGKVSPAQAGSR